jgi:predicted small lipoprotein YifL
MHLSNQDPTNAYRFACAILLIIGVLQLTGCGRKPLRGLPPEVSQTNAEPQR